MNAARRCWLGSGGGFSTFTPADLGATLKLWLDPTRGVTHGATVSAWADQSAASNGCSQGTGGLQPNYTAVGRNNLPMVSPSSGTKVLTSGTNLFAAGTPRSIFVVWTNGSTGGSQPGRLVSVSLGAGAFIVASFDFGGRSAVYTDVTTNIQTVPMLDYSQPTILMVSWDGNNTHNVACEVNGVAQTIVNSAGTATATESGSAGYGFGDGVNSFTGDRGDVIVCDTVLSAANKAKVTAYLKSKWAIA